MSQNTAILVGIVALIVGGILGAQLFPNQVNVPGETIVETVEVEVPGETVTITETLTLEDTYLTPAYDEFYDKYDKDDFLLKCNNETFDNDQLNLVWFRDYGISVEEDDWEKYTVSSDIKIKYIDDAVDSKCYNKYQFSVVYEEDEKPVVTASLL